MRVIVLRAVENLEKTATSYYASHKAQIGLKHKQYQGTHKMQIAKHKKMYNKKVKAKMIRPRKQMHVGLSYTFMRR